MTKPATNTAKVKRQKMIVIGGVALLIALVAFQGPKVMKGLRSKPTTGQTASAPSGEALGEASGGNASGSTGTTETSSSGSLASSTVTPGAAKLPADPDPAPAPQQGQLVSFSLFKSHDPFVPQLGAEGTPPAGGRQNAASTTPAAPASTTPDIPPATVPATATPAATRKTAPPATTPPAPPPAPATTPATAPKPAPTPAPTPTPPTRTATPATTPPATAPPTTTPPAASATSAVISVNGASETVKVGAAFPAATPVFRLVAIKKGVAQIGIAGGSLQGGAQTVPLSKGQTVTLMNTADGTRYVLKLVSVS
jgi:hypothetical protein